MFLNFPLLIHSSHREENNDQNIRIAELVSECWIEPQHGVVANCPRTRNYMMNLQYQQIPDAVSQNLFQNCLRSLLLFFSILHSMSWFTSALTDKSKHFTLKLI